jgi:iron complex transport system substrate-binding protein
VRIASLVPSATESLFALGLGEDVVGVTHECDYPPAAKELPHLTRSVIPEGLAADEIDRAVRDLTERGEAIYELDSELLHELQPDLIVTQALCAVCAVSVDDVRAVAEEIGSKPAVISLDPTTLGEVLADLRRLGAATGVEDDAEALLEEAADRLDAVRERVAGAAWRPRVAALEWLDPVFIGGHWVPQMIELAGGEDVLGLAGEKSRTSTWDEVAAAGPEVVVVMPCGFDEQGCAAQAESFRMHLETLGAKVHSVDASAYFSRPGPRLVDGVELLADLLHA